jgi:predicted TIM-barrel fold metal-dependent hydrolase
MLVRLIDVQCGFGGASAGRHVVAVGELLAEMDRLEIERALVRTAPDDLDQDVLHSNAMLLAAAAGDRRLVPCPVVLPAEAGDVPSEAEQAAAAVKAGAGAVCVRPALDCWSLAPWACGKLFTALQEHRLPVVCAQKHVPLQEVGRLAGAYPQLPVVVAGAGYRQLRTLLPLLEAFPNTYLCIGGTFTVQGGLERLVERVGAGRLLFGTGFPEVEPMMAVTQLTYSALSDEQKALVGARNFERLFSEVLR